MAIPAFYISAFFLNDGVPALGLFPTIRIRDINTKVLLVADDAVEEVGDGFYRYDFLGFDANKNYAVRIDGTNVLTRFERWQVGGNEAFTQDLRDEYRNKKELIKIDDNNFQEKLFSDDGLTVIRTTNIEKVDANTERRTPA